MEWTVQRKMSWVGENGIFYYYKILVNEVTEGKTRPWQAFCQYFCLKFVFIFATRSEGSYRKEAILKLKVYQVVLGSMVAQGLVFPPRISTLLSSNLNSVYCVAFYPCPHGFPLTTKNIGDTKFAQAVNWFVCMWRDVLRWTGIPSKGLSLTFIQCFWNMLWIHGDPDWDKAVTVHEWMLNDGKLNTYVTVLHFVKMPQEPQAATA